MPPAYTIHLIPHPLPVHSLTPLARKLREFKLHALLSDPKAFSQNHATESLLPLSAWETRVANLDFRIVVCVVEDADRDGISLDDKNKEAEEEHIVQRLLESEWAGTFTLVGPIPLSSWLFPSSGQPQPPAEGEETRWHLTSLFVLPAHRGRGLASKLTLAAVRAGSSGHQIAGNVGATTTRFRLIVHPKNIEVVKLYESLGFVKGGLYTQREAMMAMGDAAGIPEVTEGDIWDSRLAIGMERLV